jgi:CheY-like chemotaxis protein
MDPAPPTLLLVDDDKEILTVLCRSLRHEGYRILTTVKPEEALAILEAERVDVLVSDVIMPAMSGLDLVDRARTAFPTVVRVILTAQQSLELVMEAINRGEVFRYLTKPWETDKMREAIRAAVRHADVLRRAAALDAAVNRRTRVLAEIVRREPGIAQVERTKDGVYELDVSVERLRARLALGVEPGDGPLSLLGRLLGEEVSAKEAEVERPARRSGAPLVDAAGGTVAGGFLLVGALAAAASSPSGRPSGGDEEPTTLPVVRSSAEPEKPLSRPPALSGDAAPRSDRVERNGPEEGSSSPASGAVEPAEKPPFSVALWTMIAFAVVLALLLAAITLLGR